MIVFPMAGLSRRFTDAGYTVPKYMLEAHGKTLFAHAVSGFSHYFGSRPFRFVCRDVAGTPDFVARECRALGLAEVSIVVLEAPTAGQAETVALGLTQEPCAVEEPLTIFNIDTFHRAFRFPEGFDVGGVDGYLEVFRGSGANWSYVRPSEERPFQVVETTEKVPISDLCCTGLYHFGATGLYLDAWERFRSDAAEAMGLRELYVAPMYNLLIRDGRDIRYSVIGADDVVFCGTPEEYDVFLGRDPA